MEFYAIKGPPFSNVKLGLIKHIKSTRVYSTLLCLLDQFTKKIRYM